MSPPSPSQPRLTLPRDRIADFCRRNGIERLALFGSILRDDFRPDSDIDILVWFRPEATPTLGGLAMLEDELTDIVGRKVDLRTPAELGSRFRDAIIENADVQFAA